MDGEIKGMNKGVLEIETDYSDKNFFIEWDGISKLKSKTIFRITTSKGERLNGSIDIKNGQQVKITEENSETIVDINDIVFLKSVDKTFLGNLSANVDVGFSIAKANDLRQINASGLLAYNTDKWQTNFTINSLKSSQDDIEDTQRNSGGLTFDYFLPKDYFATINYNYLTNTEQSIKIRTVLLLGIGKYIIHNNTSYWSISTGASYLNETFTTYLSEDSSLVSTPKSKEAEWYIGTELNLFNTGDLSLFVNGKAYNTLGNTKRWRFDLSGNVKYDLPLDFYIKMGTNLNFDSKPAEEGREVDYQYTFGVGWEL